MFKILLKRYLISLNRKIIFSISLSFHEIMYVGGKPQPHHNGKVFIYSFHTPCFSSSDISQTQFADQQRNFSSFHSKKEQREREGERERKWKRERAIGHAGHIITFSCLPSLSFRISRKLLSVQQTAKRCNIYCSGLDTVHENLIFKCQRYFLSVLLL